MIEVGNWLASIQPFTVEDVQQTGDLDAGFQTAQHRFRLNIALARKVESCLDHCHSDVSLMKIGASECDKTVCTPSFWHCIGHWGSRVWKVDYFGSNDS